MAKKIGYLKDIVKPELYRYIIISIMEEHVISGYVSNDELKKQFKINIPDDVNAIMFRLIDDYKFQIELIKYYKSEKDSKSEIGGAGFTKLMFIINLKEKTLPVYDSLY